MIDIRDGQPIWCKKCDLAFSTFGLYRLHMTKVHKKAYSCEVCEKRFSLPNTLIKHRLNYHTNFPKKCTDCELVLMTKQQFIQHVNTEHSNSFQAKKI